MFMRLLNLFGTRTDATRSRVKSHCIMYSVFKIDKSSFFSLVSKIGFFLLFKYII